MTMELHSDGTRGGRSWTNDLWQTCPWQGIGNDPGLGFRFFTDFVGENAADWTGNAIAGSGAIAQASAHFGHLVLTAAAATDTHGVNAGLGGATSAFVTPSASTTIFFECLVKQTLQTSTLGSSFMGLCTQPSTTVPLGTTGALATSVNRIGFNCLDSAALNFNYLDSGATAYTASVSDTVVTDEWMKLGFRINGLTSVTPYINSVRQATIVASSTATLPDGVMNLAFSVVSGGGTGTPTMTLDWVRFACVDNNQSVVTTT